MFSFPRLFLPSLSLVQTILSKETEIVETREKSKNEFDKRLRLIQNDIDKNDELKNRIRQLENDLKGKINKEIF
jgi:uncharacterized membrane protein